MNSPDFINGPVYRKHNTNMTAAKNPRRLLSASGLSAPEKTARPQAPRGRNNTTYPNINRKCVWYSGVATRIPKNTSASATTIPGSAYPVWLILYIASDSAPLLPHRKRRHRNGKQRREYPRRQRYAHRIPRPAPHNISRGSPAITPVYQPVSQRRRRQTQRQRHHSPREYRRGPPQPVQPDDALLPLPTPKPTYSNDGSHAAMFSTTSTNAASPPNPSASTAATLLSSAPPGTAGISPT